MLTKPSLPGGEDKAMTTVRDLCKPSRLSVSDQCKAADRFALCSTVLEWQYVGHFEL